MSSVQNIAQFLFCLSELEEKTFQLYHDLSQKVEFPSAKAAFLTIAEESRKHSSMLKRASKGFTDVQFAEKECKKGLGETWNYVINLSKSLEKQKTFELEDLLKLCEKLSLIEYSYIEEYSVSVKLKTLQYMSQEISDTYKVNLNSIKKALEVIIKDEESHQSILNELTEQLTKDHDEQYKSPIRRFPLPSSIKH
jgi:rubrerythrin